MTLRGLVWLPVAGCALWAIGRAFGLERGYPLVALMAFTPYVAVGSIVVVAVALVLRRWSAAAVAAVACAVLVSAVVPRVAGGANDAATPGGPTLRVASSNVEFAGASEQGIVAFVKRERIDVLALQEINGPYVERLRKAGLEKLLPERVVRLGPQTSGTALYARTKLRPRPPIEGTSNPLAVATTEVRGAPPVELVSVHPMAPSTPARTSAWAEDLGRVPPATPDGAVRILAGDFNATLDHAPLRAVLETGYRDAAEQLGAGLAPTWPVGKPVPPVTIDHVLADRRCGVRSIETHEIERTDHRAVVAELVLPARQR